MQCDLLGSTKPGFPISWPLILSRQHHDCNGCFVSKNGWKLSPDVTYHRTSNFSHHPAQNSVICSSEWILCESIACSVSIKNGKKTANKIPCKSNLPQMGIFFSRRHAFHSPHWIWHTLRWSKLLVILTMNEYISNRFISLSLFILHSFICSRQKGVALKSTESNSDFWCDLCLWWRTPQPTLNNEAEHLGEFKVGIDWAIRITQEVTVPGRVEGFSNIS